MNTATSCAFDMRLPIPGVVYPSPSHLSKYADLGVLGRKTLPGVLRAVAAAQGERPAIVGPDGSISHRELDALSDRLAAALLRLGLRPLDRAVMHLGDSPQLLIAFMACLKAGVIPVCTLAAHREMEIGQLAAQSQARLIWAQGDNPKFDHVGFAERMAAEHVSLAHLVSVGGPARGSHPTMEGLIASIDQPTARRLLDEVEHDPLQVAVFQLSGGTTGTPKIIPRFHSEYVYNLEASARYLGLASDDILYMPTPMMHNLHVACGWGPTLLAGGAVLVTPHVTPDVVAQTIATHRPTRLCLPPPVLAKATQSAHWSAEPLKAVRGMLSPFNARGLRQALGVPVFHVFGMTEGVIMYTQAGDPDAALFDTVGKPISEHDEVRVLAPGTEQEVALGEVGELAIRGPYTLFGYFAAAERNREAFTSDGFYRSGDLMSALEIDGKRYYQFRGRLKDVVDRGGEKVNADEVEQAVMRCGAFLAVAVVGAPDPVFTERVCACVIPRPGATLPDVATLGRHLESIGLAKFKWPERIEVIDAVPLTHAGKPDKAALKRSLFTEESKP